MIVLHLFNDKNNAVIGENKYKRLFRFDALRERPYIIELVVFCSFVCGAVAPACVVPSMIRFQAQGLGVSSILLFWPLTWTIFCQFSNALYSNCRLLTVFQLYWWPQPLLMISLPLTVSTFCWQSLFRAEVIDPLWANCLKACSQDNNIFIEIF